VRTAAAAAGTQRGGSAAAARRQRGGSWAAAGRQPPDPPAVLFSYSFDIY